MLDIEIKGHTGGIVVVVGEDDGVVEVTGHGVDAVRASIGDGEHIRFPGRERGGRALPCVVVDIESGADVGSGVLGCVTADPEGGTAETVPVKAEEQGAGAAEIRREGEFGAE